MWQALALVFSLLSYCRTHTKSVPNVGINFLYIFCFGITYAALKMQ